MFPNVRLIIVAISASMLAIVCAMSLFLGMFAAFSVAHEPFATLQSTKPPLQIAFGGDSLAPVVDGRTSPFGIRFQLNAPQAPNGPVIVAVPAALDHAAPAETSAEAPSNPAANAQANSQSSSQPRSQSMAATPEDDATVQTSLRDAPAAAPAAAAPSTEVKPSPAKLDEASKDDSTATVTAPAAPPIFESPAVAGVPHHIAPEIKIVAREADNPASVATSPAPTLARKAIKRRRLAVHLHQSHHFRRPRIYSIATNPASGYVQPNAYIQPGVVGQIGMTGYSQPSANAPPAVSSSKASSSRRRRSSPRP